MPQITNTIYNHEGQNAKITIRLIGVWTADGINEILPSNYMTVTSDSNGVWTATLPAQSTFEGTTYYEAREPNNVTHTFTVADSPSVQSLRSRLATPVSIPTTLPLKLDDLSDVSVPTPSTGQALTWNGTTWVASTTSSSSASQILISVVASISLSGHRAVTKQSDGTLIYADCLTLAHLNVPIWITQNSVSSGALDQVVAYGVLDEPTWSWTPNNPIYLGANGVLTQTIPTSPSALFLAQIAVATSPTSIFVDRIPSIKLV